MAGTSVTSRHVDAPVDAVASILADPRAYDGIVVGSRKVRWFDPRWPEDGTAFHHTVGFGPVVIRDKTTVLRDALPDEIELAAARGTLLDVRDALHLTTGRGTDRLALQDQRGLQRQARSGSSYPPASPSPTTDLGSGRARDAMVASTLGPACRRTFSPSWNARSRSPHSSDHGGGPDGRR